MKVILTGHSRGLGAAIAADLLARGLPMLGISRASHAALAKRYPALLEEAEVDLGNPLALQAFLAGGVLQAFIGSDRLALINNAGTVQPVGVPGSQGAAAIAAAISLNVAAPLMLADAVLAAGAAETRILHVSSGAGRNAYPGWSVYCATKAALDHHARSVALDQLEGLRICSLAPGVIDTDMQAEIRASSLDQFPIRACFEELKNTGGLATPEDCARGLVNYLLGASFGAEPVADLRDHRA